MLLIENIAELEDLSAQLIEFEEQIINLADMVGLSLNDFHCDHISVRCNHISTAERWRKGFMKCGLLLSEKEINGRPICLFDLDQPIIVLAKPVDCIELPYPGSKVYPHEGWEHIELVVPGDPEFFHQNALALLSDRGLVTPGIDIKFSNPKAEGEKLANLTLAISNGAVTIKLHPYSIRKVIANELH